MGGGVVLAGLVRRRAAEADLFTRGVRLHNGGPALDAEPATIAREPETETKTPWWQRVFGWWR
jgi:hypothetical protein